MDRLTELVISYKETRNEAVVPEIVKLSEGLIWGVFKYYKIANLPAPLQQEIALDCRSLILVRSIEAFNADRKAKFSTFYTWRLKSHVRSRRGFFLRRKELGYTVSLDATVNDRTSGDGGPRLAETITNPNYSYRSLGQFKKRIADIFTTA